MNHLASALRRLHIEGSLTSETLKTWRDQALAKIATNSGQTIGNASGHGISFSAAGRITWDAWFALLDSVLHSVARNTKLSGKSIARF